MECGKPDDWGGKKGERGSLEVKHHVFGEKKEKKRKIPSLYWAEYCYPLLLFG